MDKLEQLKELVAQKESLRGEVEEIIGNIEQILKEDISSFHLSDDIYYHPKIGFGFDSYRIKELIDEEFWKCARELAHNIDVVFDEIQEQIEFAETVKEELKQKIKQ